MSHGVCEQAAYWLVSNGLRLEQEMQVHHALEIPLTKCIISGVEGDDFSLRVNKDAYPDGAVIYVKGKERGSWTYQFDAWADYAYTEGPHLMPEVAKRARPFWEFRGPDWAFGEIDLVWVLIVKRTETGAFTKPTSVIYNVQPLLRSWRAANADEYLIERLSRIRLDEHKADQPGSSMIEDVVASPPTLPAALALPAAPATPAVTAPPAAFASNAARASPATAPSKTVPAVATLQNTAGRPPSDTRFDPLAVARLARGLRPLNNANRVAPRKAERPSPSPSPIGSTAPHSSNASTSLRVDVAPPRRGLAEQEEQRSGPLNEETPSEIRNHSPSARRPPKANEQRERARFVAKKPDDTVDTKHTDGFDYAGDSDDDVPLDQLARKNLGANIDALSDLRLSLGRRRSGRLQEKRLEEERLEAQRLEERRFQGEGWQFKAVKLKRDNAAVEELKAYWRSSASSYPQLGYFITVSEDRGKGKEREPAQEHSDGESADGDDDAGHDEAYRLVPLDEIAAPFRMIMGDAAKPYRQRPLPATKAPPVGLELKRRSSVVKKKKETPLDRCEIDFVDPELKRQWKSYQAWKQYEAQNESETRKRQSKQGARTLPRSRS